MTQWIAKLLGVTVLSFASLGAYEGTLQVRAAAFFPTSHKFTRVYGDVLPDYQAEAGLVFENPYELWTNVDWFTKHRSASSCCKTRVDVTNGSFGVKYVFDNQFYVGLGPTFGKIVLHNKTCCGNEHKSKFAAGLVVKSGFRYPVSTSLFLDVFADYLYQPVHFHHTVDVGGFKVGAGLGTYF